ncbi:ATP-binding cassette domain-containing protein [Hyphomonas sp. WL0036]|uniref:ABC-F family ATP-binding cassette domain-containing protein n=1 Tax=Hyphomonas sediminis TaxID=2866160 RepID=UPI001C80A2E5|nr:ABC-F family ATP-binding cassette domain-containing protein [Hyphomonas sediminis]MBY9068320.1 ATP-binding cassette domain-containing protein [Hyphomonas sediminis]
MPASITLSSLTFALPDGRVLFSDLNFSFGHERIGLVGRNGVGKSTLLGLIAGAMPATTGVVSVVGATGLLRQSFEPEPFETVADLMGVTEGLARLARIESGGGDEADFADADWTLEQRLAEALTQAGLPEMPPGALLATLSGGQRTRISIAALILAQPDFLLLDEPTNNLDREGREALAELLGGWPGGAIVVSHDRALLETMDAIVELTTLGAARYGGGWSAYEAQKALELAAAQQDLAEAERRIGEVNEKARLAAARKARRDGAGSRKGAKGDMPRILSGTLKRRAEASKGDIHRLGERQKSEANEAASAARARIEVLQPFTVKLAGTGLTKSRKVVTARDLVVGYDASNPTIRGLTFEMVGPERVCVSGPNGSGKSTLLKTVAGALQPIAGEVCTHVRMAMLDQDVTLLDPADTILQNYRRINPEADENACRAVLARFRFRADAALQQAGSLSGGERLRAGLACVLGGQAPPQLLILDEPTNHLDISSLEVVEAGLNAYDGALLVVSHDNTFLQKTGIARKMDLKSGLLS